MMTRSENEDENLPDDESAREFYAKYEPKEILGSGVSSTVRRCIAKDTGKEYAVKIIDLTEEEDVNEAQAEEIREQTRREMSILRQCSEHANIITLHDTFESPTFIFLVMEMCKKGELFDYLTEVVTLSEKRTRLVMRQLLEAVSFCHERMIVHRDLKPENILLDDNLNVKLSDFGFATFVEHDEECMDLFGTPGYLAPDVLKVSMYDDSIGYGRPVDMWAIGVIMYTLMVGCPPFWHRKQMYMLRAIMEARYTLTSPEWEDISEPPKDLIAKLLVLDPSERLTATEALNHPFFKREERDQKQKFLAKRKFKSAVRCVMACQRIKTLHLNPPPISLDTVRTEPYSVKTFRRIIDAGAFRIYGHWVKKGATQNRAALFENVPKKDLKTTESHGSFTVGSEFIDVEVGDNICDTERPARRSGHAGVVALSSGQSFTTPLTLHIPQQYLTESTN